MEQLAPPERAVHDCREMSALLHRGAWAASRRQSRSAEYRTADQRAGSGWEAVGTAFGKSSAWDFARAVHIAAWHCRGFSWRSLCGGGLLYLMVAVIPGAAQAIVDSVPAKAGSCRGGRGWALAHLAAKGSAQGNRERQCPPGSCCHCESSEAISRLRAPISHTGGGLPRRFAPNKKTKRTFFRRRSGQKIFIQGGSAPDRWPTRNDSEGA